jgi:MFS family permease
VSGIKDGLAGTLQACSFIAGAFGNLLGGKIGDSFARRWPNHGRAFTAQISVIAGIPIAALIFMVPAPQGWAFPWYLFLVVSLGLLASWCAVGVNWPILTQIVAPDNRGAVMAWEAAVEGCFASVVGNLAVSFFAETLLGFDLKKQEAQVKSGGEGGNVFALGFALMMTSAVPWALCLAFYTMLHWSLPRDLRRMQEVDAANKLGAAQKGEAPPSV